MQLYRNIHADIAPMKYGVDPVDQLSDRLEAALIDSGLVGSLGVQLTLAGFICPLYEIDESRLGGGFSQAITGVGRGDLEDYPRYKKKFERLLGFVDRLNHLMPNLCIRLNLIMGNKGVINANQLSQQYNLSSQLEGNIESYRRYLDNRGFHKSTMVKFSKATDLIGGEVTDLCEDGKNSNLANIGKAKNERVFRKVDDEVKQSVRKGTNPNEILGFVANYGHAGICLSSAGIDILVGTDAAGSYMNYLYHAYIRSEELLIMVPK